MGFIRYVPSDQLASAERVADPDHIIQIHAVHPAVMRHHYELYRELMHGPGPLTRREREILAVRVSGLNQCPYWIHHHGAGLRRILSAEGMAAASQAELVDGLIATGPLAVALLTDRERALVTYADKLTHAPASIRAADIEALRSHGLRDLAIHDACAIAAYFAFVNRIADGLGVELEDKPSGSA